ncbi:hypothetical protein BKA70DRAFT_1256626 [Coprinopsis sp. MPI-PUGE-AT-0042]|nr:hypothetical protein BKA70DRAFT_1256626 [Coprinopsis sp. MPI-PUGE-AT-0042]
MKVLSLLAISLFSLIVEAAPTPVEKVLFTLLPTFIHLIEVVTGQLPELPVEPAYANGPKTYWVRSVPGEVGVVPVEPAYANGPDRYWVRDEVTVDEVAANGPTYWVRRGTEAEELEA